MRILLLLLTACGDSTVKVGDETGGAPEPADADGDGFDAVAEGGSDCDDANPAVNPEASEVWYDGVEQECSGGSDFDQDGDGVDAAPAGDDCDDTDHGIFPGAPEEDDLVDQDCDGVADEDSLSSGMVVVTEVMHHPLSASDAEGEWFEIVNTSADTLELAGWTFRSDDGDAFTVDGSLVLEGGGRAVLGVSANMGLNGGVAVDYVYDRAQFSFSADDSIFVMAAEATLFDVSWSSSWPNQDGRSLSLDPDHLATIDARQSAYWCVASSAPQSVFGPS